VLVESYERLRARVLAGRPDGWRLGHGLLASRGVAGWIAAGAARTVAAARPADPAATTPPARTDSDRPGADQLVAVLAQMALAHT